MDSPRFGRDTSPLLSGYPVFTEKRASRRSSWEDEIRRRNRHTTWSLLFHNRRILSLVLGALIALFVLVLHSSFAGVVTSPRAIVSHGWQHAQGAIRTHVNGLDDFTQAPGCNVSSLDLHQPFSPLCRDRKSLLDAMTGGGRLGLDAPYTTRGCDMQWFSSEEICSIMNRFDHIYIVGDSMMRHTAQAFQVLLRADLINGGRATWKQDAADRCTCRTVFNDPGCVWSAAVDTQEVITGDPTSIHCKKAPGIVSWQPALAYPLSADALAFVSKIENKDQPNGRNVFVLGHGLWNDLESETTMAWMEQLEDAMMAELPAYYKSDPSLFPRLFITPSAQGEGKPDVFHPAQNNIRMQRHQHAVSAFAASRGYENLGFYNLTVQASSPDGSHASFENNLVKAMMVLNWLNMLDPPKATVPRPAMPSTSGEVNIQPLHEDYHLEAAPTDITALPTYTHREDLATRTAKAATTSAMPSPADFSAGIIPTIPSPSSTKTRPKVSSTPHPIDDLVAQADSQHNDFLAKRSYTVNEAAAAYRERRGRHPPPSFDKWFSWAADRKTVVVEDFFDQIYSDLDPFWGVSAQEMREFPRSWNYVLSIRNGTMRRWNDEPPNIAPWMDMWEHGFSSLPLHDLPDVDLAFNGEDEPKLFVPWEIRNQARLEGAKSKHTDKIRNGRPVQEEFGSLHAMNLDRPAPEFRTAFEWMDIRYQDPLWLAARETCPPDSPARIADAYEDYTKAPVFTDPTSVDWMTSGYVSNWTQAKSSCANPGFRNIHGSFIAMQSEAMDNPRSGQKAVVQKLVPLLSGCKIHDVNSEILIPPAVQWPNKADAEGAESFNFNERNRQAWEDKQDAVFWRGSASGGINTADDWTRFQRHRFIAMQNGTLVAAHQAVSHLTPPAHVPGGRPMLPHNFPLPDRRVYPLAALSEGRAAARALGNWVSDITDAAFIHLRCYPPISWFEGNGATCAYSGPYYNVKPIIPGAEAFKYKYQPDLDGASYSGRYRAILQSNSLPMKATIYDEWHDSRLVPWKHFVPMDVSNVDWWGLLEYFFGFKEKRAAHDDVARKISLDGSEWARTVLRTDDMLVYMYRLILEMARLMDEQREHIGFIEDL